MVSHYQLSRYFLKPFFLHCKIPEVAIKLISTVVICELKLMLLKCFRNYFRFKKNSIYLTGFFGVLNSLSVSFFANVQMVMTTLTVMTIILISSFGLVPILQGWFMYKNDFLIKYFIICFHIID